MWNGMFRPVLQKHRLGTGDIANHLIVNSIELIDAQQEDAVAEKLGEQDIELRHVGDGTTYSFLVEISFVDGTGEAYQFVYESDNPEPDPDTVLHELAHSITP